MKAATHIGDRSTMDRDRGLSLYQATRRSVSGEKQPVQVVDQLLTLVVVREGTSMRRVATSLTAQYRKSRSYASRAIVLK